MRRDSEFRRVDLLSGIKRRYIIISEELSMEQFSFFPDQQRPDKKAKPKKPEFRFLSTRFQGSKLKIVGWIWSLIKNLKFDSCLDAFGGTGSVAYMFKLHKKRVDYNDNLRFNYIIGKAIIENDNVILEEAEIVKILQQSPGIVYPTFIQDTFKDIFYMDNENKWLDVVVNNIRSIEDEYKRCIALTALFQACIIKRPYNLFHRANLYMRKADVKRNFGNKTTWDKPFDYYFRKFSQEVNSIIFPNGRQNRAFCEDVFSIKPNYDLVYIDTPYTSEKGIGVDYLDFYHFLEGLVDYDKWPDHVDYNYKHRRLKGGKSVFCQKDKIYDAFNRLFRYFKDSIIVVSYRSHGIPSEEEMVELLSRYKNDVKVHHMGYQYVLSHLNGKEILLIGT